MKNNRTFLCAALPILALSLLVGCNKKQPEESSEKKPLEIGDTVKEWTSKKDLEEAPLAHASKTGLVEIVDDFGNEDNSSILYKAEYNAKTAYIGSDLLEKPYFTEDDAKNGDLISLYAYVPGNGNIATLQLEVFPISMNDSIKSKAMTFGEDNLDQWVRIMVTFDTLETLGAIRLNYTVEERDYLGIFYIDDINITYGEETVKTDYEYNDESLYLKYQDYFKVGGCMSASMLNNTMLRKIAKDNYNSLTAENECKPERILDQNACQRLADDSEVAITVKPFEKLYDFCEVNHIGARHHTFVWFDQTPSWFFREGYESNGAVVGKEKMLKRMENFIKTTLNKINTRWPGLVYAIDVSNESIVNGAVRKKDNNNQNPNYWYDTIGSDFVYCAFKFARQYAAEGQELYYNDYQYDYQTSNCTFAVNTLLKEAIAEELIDGVGIQSHLDANNFSLDAVIKDCEIIKAKGLKCQLTELDITVSGSSTTVFNNQKKCYKDLVTRVLEGNASGKTDVNAIILWGITDNLSWRGSQNPLLFNSKYGKKPAYYGFLEALDEVYPPEEESQEE